MPCEERAPNSARGRLTEKELDVYNRRWRHSSVGMIFPVEFENRLTQTAQARLTVCPLIGGNPSVWGR